MVITQTLYTDVTTATEADIQAATLDSIPQVAPMFFMFRVMVGCGVLMLFLIAIAFTTVHVIALDSVVGI